MRHYLVVANQTLRQPALTERILSCHRTEACDFHLLVPATHAHDHSRWTETEALALARRRLLAALAHLRSEGVDVHGEVGEPSPVAAISEVLRRRSYDELILSTLPPGASQWLRGGLPDRIEQLFGLPVTHVVSDPLEIAGVGS